MPKVKNWSRQKEGVDERDFPYVWNYDGDDNAKVVVKRKLKLTRDEYDAYAISEDNPGQVFIIKNTKKLERARKEAVEWMRDHSETLPEEIL